MSSLFKDLKLFLLATPCFFILCKYELFKFLLFEFLGRKAKIIAKKIDATTKMVARLNSFL